MNEVKAKFNGYCDTCKFSIFKGETIQYNGHARHVDCIKAMTDSYPRRFNPSLVSMYGKVERKLMKRQLEGRNLLEDPTGSR